MFYFSDKEYVLAIELYITNDYLYGTYDSCKQVSMPSTGQPALDLMCPPYGAAGCTALRWFRFMGTASPENPFVPFQITYVNTDKQIGKYQPLNSTVVPCNQGIDVSNHHETLITVLLIDFHG